MKTLAKLLAFGVAVGLAGCNVVGSLAEYQAKATAVAESLEREFGSKPAIEWNVSNGKLTDVTIIFDGGAVASLTVKDLGARTRAAVIAHFKEDPAQVMVSTRWGK